MDNTKIYEDIMLTTCFNKLKAIRDGWSEDKGSKYGLATIIDIGGADYRSYDFIMDKCESIILEMIPYVVMELLKAYDIKTQWYQFKRNDARIYYYDGQNEYWKDYFEQSNNQTVFAFSCEDNVHTGILFIFKEFGLGNQLPQSLIDIIISQNKLKHYYYISLVEKDAYKEILNHNDNINDPSRGTEIFSLKYFFNSFFGEEEYRTFKDYADKFTDKVKDYFGFQIVRTLKPNTLHNYRRIVRENLHCFDISAIDIDGRISESQRKIIEKQFFEEKNCELLIGSCDFAQSYMTAEWLFSSLADAGNIDLTAIVMGYFKSIEQLLFDFIKLHTTEKDGAVREIYVGRGKTERITNALLEDDKKSKDINLGSLTGFFGFYKKDINQYISKNNDLFVLGIAKDMREYIIEVFISIARLRNKFFHKHNLLDWEKVREVRNRAHLVFYLLLGAYGISDYDKQELGMLEINKHDDYYRLCEYLNKKVHEIEQNQNLNPPIFYLNGKTDPYDFYCVRKDDFIEYDIYGEPIYSGIYFSQKNENIRFQKEKTENFPREIWEGILNISKSIPIEIKPTGPQKKIYAEGKFFC